jgi:hypothetical protein
MDKKKEKVSKDGDSFEPGEQSDAESTTNSLKTESKGLETLLMLQRTLGVKEDQ